MQTTIEYALHYARLGMKVLPLHSPVQSGDGMVCSCGKAKCTSPGKHPVGRLAPNGLKDGTVDESLIWRWFSQPDLNIGIVTGAASNIVVLDIDPRHDGDETLAALEKSYSPLPQTWRFLTGGGGEHIIFRHPGGIVPNSAGKIGPGIDVRGDGGYIVAPPSRHISGRPYAISVDHDPVDMPHADIPSWLLPLLQAPPQKQAKAATAQEWRKRIFSSVPEGERNAMAAKLTGHLLRNRIDPWVTAELVNGWNRMRCQPPLPDSEIMATVRSIARKEIRRRKDSHAGR